MVPMMIFKPLNNYWRHVNYAAAMIISILANVVNLLDGSRIWYLGFPQLGLRGSGISTLITRIAMAVVILVMLWMQIKFKF